MSLSDMGVILSTTNLEEPPTAILLMFSPSSRSPFCKTQCNDSTASSTAVGYGCSGAKR